MTRRIVITAAGACTSLGFSQDEMISGLRSGLPSFERPAFDPEVVTCPIDAFDFRSWLKKAGRTCRERRYLNRGAQFCMVAALEALAEAGLSESALEKAGLFMGTGPHLDIGDVFPNIENGKLDRKDLMALWMLKFLPNTPASVIARTLGLHGENLTINTACAASLTAIGEAFRKIKDGYLELALAGGGDSRIHPGGILAYKKAQALYSDSINSEDGRPERHHPENASRPFEKNRKGFVPGEGGAVFLLEELHHARRRGATILAEISGFGTSLDGYNMTAPDPAGQWAEKAVRHALYEADLPPEAIDVISAHGTGTALNDQMEADLMDRVFGSGRPHVIALKSWVGHISAACGAVELALCLTCMKHRYLPEVRNLETPCHPKVHFVRKAFEMDIKTLLLQNFGFGGQNSALVVKQFDG
jgi:3-oxoacyl-[acyl-carrier-protein] synthase II